MTTASSNRNDRRIDQTRHDALLPDAATAAQIVADEAGAFVALNAIDRAFSRRFGELVGSLNRAGQIAASRVRLVLVRGAGTERDAVGVSPVVAVDPDLIGLVRLLVIAQRAHGADLLAVHEEAVVSDREHRQVARIVGNPIKIAPTAGSVHLTLLAGLTIEDADAFVGDRDDVLLLGVAVDGVDEDVVRRRLHQPGDTLRRRAFAETVSDGREAVELAFQLIGRTNKVGLLGDAADESRDSPGHQAHSDPQTRRPRISFRPTRGLSKMLMSEIAVWSRRRLIHARCSSSWAKRSR